MASTYDLIAAVTVGSGGASSIDFSSIPSTYTDLELKLSFRLTTNSVDMAMKINNSSSAEYYWAYIRYNPAVSVAGGNSSAQTSDTYPMFSVASTWTSNTFGNASMYIPNYSVASNKTYIIDSGTENNSTDAWGQLHNGGWRNTAAINRITFTNPSGDFAQYSTAYLYGISNA
jgi:hypothetical protein